MIELRNYSIRTRLYAMALLGIVVMLAMGLRGLQLLGQAGELIEEFAKIQVGAVADAGHVRAGVGNLRRFEKDVLINMADKGTVDHYIKSWEGIYGDVDAGLKKLAQEKLHPDVAVIVGGMRDGLAGYRAAFLKVAEGVRNGEFADAGAANKALTPAKPAIRQIDENLVKLIERIDADGAASLEIIHANERNVRWRQALLVGLGGAAIVAFTFFNIRSILEPLQAVMATAERIASKDLRQDVDTRGVDETADMMRGVQGVQEVLRGVVGTVSHATDSIATASAEVASGSHDLSQRTEEAASRLQATASAMDELTASVRSNADSARQASHLARQAAEVTQRGGTVVGEVVDTMGRISASSHKIIDIISVIDSIAFQTNILALNAAVEAARAGEQGRGFAVVAAEVRNLAQRSAGAAKEIKSLIGASTESVDSGARLVQQAGDTMREIVSSIERVNGIISEISAASSEQAQGINQIGEAISQLDQMTQQNAALVEQSAAAASSLQQQAEDLASSVAVFRMG